MQAAEAVGGGRKRAWPGASLTTGGRRGTKAGLKQGSGHGTASWLVHLNHPSTQAQRYVNTRASSPRPSWQLLTRLSFSECTLSLPRSREWAPARSRSRIPRRTETLLPRPNRRLAAAVPAHRLPPRRPRPRRTTAPSFRMPLPTPPRTRHQTRSLPLQDLRRQTRS